MINNSYSFENVIFIVDDVIRPSYLNKIQEIILKQVWEGKTYSEIASLYNYDAEYIKTKGCELWKLLSKSFGTQISKSNFVPFMRSQISLLESKAHQPQITQTVTIEREKIHWNTAPDVTDFQGRTAELTKLSHWSQEPSCRSIVISGMVGCGKSILAAKFAQQVSSQFDYVIWFSLSESIPVKALLRNYLEIFISAKDRNGVNFSDDLSNLLNKFLEYLRAYRCLLIIDDLDSILESDCATIYYRQNAEEYSQLLRCLVATYHQSLSIFTSNIKPKMLEYYTSSRVFFMHLQGLKQSTLNLIYRNRLKTNLTELQWHSLSKYCVYNPQIINIFTSNINNILLEEDFAWTLKEISLLKEIADLIEKELKNLSELEKEIVYWLAINCSCPKSELLERRVSHFRRTISQLQESFSILKKRGLIYKKENDYVLQPLIKDYIQKKLIEIGLQC